MRKTTIGAVLAVSCATLGLAPQASAQVLERDFNPFDALGRILAGDGLTSQQTGDALFKRLGTIRGDLNRIKNGGVDETERAEYRELYTDGLAVLDRMDAEVARSGGTAEDVRWAAQLVADWRADFIEDFGNQTDAVEYVRNCDAGSTGFYYIPGAETCLRLNGNARAGISYLENTHDLGSGTVVTNGGGPDNERFGAGFKDWIRREGVGIDFRISGDYGGASLGNLPIVGIYGGYEGAWGDAETSGNAMVGYDGVTGVGYTYFEPIPNTGAIASSPGFGLETQGDLSNSWNRVNLGLKVALPIGGDGDDTGPRVRGRIGAFYEDISTEASGSAQLTYNGSPYVGYSQDWNLEAKDRYIGVRLGTHVGFKPQLDGKLKTSLGADLYLGYHSGEGSYYQQSVTGGSPINQMVDYSKNGFAIGAGITGAVSYEFAEGWKIGGKAEFSCLPDVTSFHAPQNPNEQADAGFSSQHASRMFYEIRLSRKF